VFFFQAEDGIRDKLVTGVQTCALPISTATKFFTNERMPTAMPCSNSAARKDRRKPILSAAPPHITGPTIAAIPYTRQYAAPISRSEERRVGKECRYECGPEP